MAQSMTPQASFGLFAPFILLQFLLSWRTLCSEQPTLTVDANNIRLTKESLDSFTACLTGSPAGLPADLAAEKSNWKLWMKYIIGSAAVLGSVNGRALGAIHGFQDTTRVSNLSQLLEELVKKNDRETVAHFIAGNVGEYFWDTNFGYLITELIENDWDAVRPLFEDTLAILKEGKNQSKEYGATVRRMPIGFQYERINSGKVPLDEIDRVYVFDKPFGSLLREIFFQARCSRNPNPVIREYIAESVSWFKRFTPGDILSKAVDAHVRSSVDPSHDVWARIRSFVDVETLIFIWPLVCSTWNRSYSRILAEDARIHEWFLQDLSYTSLDEIHTLAPWSHFLHGGNSAVYLGQCIINGALCREGLDDQSKKEAREYLCDAISGEAPIPKATNKSAPYEPFARLVEEGYKAHPHEMPALSKLPFLTDTEHERVVHHLVCQKKLATKLDCQWIIDNVSRIYSILGDDQALIMQVISLSANNIRQVLFVWIMIGQASGMKEETARSVFDEPGIFIEKFIRPVFVKPNEYYDFIVESGALFEMVRVYREEAEYEKITSTSRRTYEFNHFVVSLVLFFKERPDKIEKIVACMSGRLSNFPEDILRSMKDWFGIGTLKILDNRSKYPPEDVEFVRGVLTRCGLLDGNTA